MWQRIKGWATGDGIVPNHVLLTYLSVAMSLMLPVTSTRLILTQDLQVSPADLARYYALIFLPWSFKPVCGIISDHIPIFGYRRRPYMVIGLITWSAGLLLSATMAYSFDVMLVCGVALNVGAVLNDTVIDAVTVVLAQKAQEQEGQQTEDDDDADTVITVATALINDGASRSDRTETDGETDGDEGDTDGERKGTTAARVQSATMATRSFGSVLAQLLSLCLLRLIGVPRVVLGLSAVIPLLAVLSALQVHEKQHEPLYADNEEATASSLLPRMLRIMRNHLSVFKSQLRPLLFVWLLHVPQAMATDALMSFVYSGTFPGLKLWHYSLIEFVSLLSAFAGVVVYGRTFAKWNDLRWAYVATWALALVTFAADVFISLRATTVGWWPRDWPSLAVLLPHAAMQALFGRLTLMPTVILATQCCPKALQATFFNLVMSAAHAGSLVGTLLGAEVTEWLGITRADYSSLWKLLLIAESMSLVPLLLMPLLVSRRHATSTGAAEQAEEEVAAAQEAQEQEEQRVGESDDEYSIETRLLEPVAAS
ncbi:MAG: hypothetical protein MHM6MM_002613 [Cercozoa sp. M6MM]